MPKPVPVTVTSDLVKSLLFELPPTDLIILAVDSASYFFRLSAKIAVRLELHVALVHSLVVHHLHFSTVIDPEFACT